MEIFLNPEQKSCGFKNIRIRVDGAFVEQSFYESIRVRFVCNKRQCCSQTRGEFVDDVDGLTHIQCSHQFIILVARDI